MCHIASGINQFNGFSGNYQKEMSCFAKCITEFYDIGEEAKTFELILQSNSFLMDKFIRKITNFFNKLSDELERLINNMNLLSNHPLRLSLEKIVAEVEVNSEELKDILIKSSELCEIEVYTCFLVTSIERLRDVLEDIVYVVNFEVGPTTNLGSFIDIQKVNLN